MGARLFIATVLVLIVIGLITGSIAQSNYTIGNLLDVPSKVYHKITSTGQATQDLGSSYNESSFELKNCQVINRSGDYIITKEIFGGRNTCFIINASGVHIEGAGHTIAGYRDSKDYGFMAENLEDISINNISSIDFERGIYFRNVTHASITNNKLKGSLANIYVENGHEIEIANNLIASSSNYAFEIYNSPTTRVHNNIISENFRVIGYDYQEFSFFSNKIEKNVNSFSTIRRQVKELDIGQVALFNFTMGSAFHRDCLECTPNVELFPNENSLKIKTIGQNVSGSFSPQREGLYSLLTEIRDNRNNSEIIKYIYLVNATESANLHYYFRGKDPTHDQALSWGGFKSDSGSLLFTPPTHGEQRICSDWIQFSPDELPDYPFGIVKEINFSLEYKHNSPEGSIGVERFASYDTALTYSKPLPPTNGEFVKDKFSFGVDWPVNYFWEWYWIAIKIVAPNGFPTFITDEKDSGTANITYIYTLTPGIRSISNKDITLLGATMGGRQENATIQLEGDGITKLGVTMPDSNSYYRALYDGSDCETNSDCLFSHQARGELEFLLSVNGRHTLIIIPSDNPFSLDG